MSDASFSFSPKQLLMLAVAALGYFVDVYDILIFSAERIESLTAIGVALEQMKDVGLMLLNFQMAGMLIGGFFFGVMADKFGRLQLLFASILLYSLANIGNAFVTNVEAFAAARFIAGFGLAGELGVAMSWISESLARRQRTIATMIVSVVGLCGGIAAAVVASHFQWQTSYIVGGAMGLVLLVLRISVSESKVFERNKAVTVKRGSLMELFGNRKQFSKFMLCVLAGAPAFVFMSVYITLSPEFCAAFGITETVSVSRAMIVFFIVFAVSDVLCGLLSKVMHKRKAPLLIYAGIQVVAAVFFFILHPATVEGYYFRCGFLGFSVGYWGVLITNSVEQFGTNIRATVATATPNLIRGITIPSAILLTLLAGPLGVLASGTIIAFGLIAVSILCIISLEDRFENDLNFNEE